MPRTRLRRPPGALALLFAVAVGAAGSFGVLTSAEEQSAQVQRVEGLDDVLAANDGPAENYLLVGSDSRENVDPNDPNAAVYGSPDDVVGRRSDTIMVLRREKSGGASMVSLPRDLWVEIAGTDESAKINSAYNGGPDRLAATVTQALDIPIHHYVEIDFVGFTRMVDEVGGVDICFDYPTRDANSGLDVQPGCQRLNGVQSLAYARSRYFEEFIDGDWVMDGRADIGRIERQQIFIRAAVTQLLAELEGNPFGMNDLIGAAADAVRIDEGADPVAAAIALRAAASTGLQTYALPVVGVERQGQSALELDDGADAILDYFRGIGPQPVTEPPPSVPTATMD
ncbi:MAG: LCP family protein [Actinomycetota bacterium]|nr:LCP family protein [Actinomycetota bacterium]